MIKPKNWPSRLDFIICNGGRHRAFGNFNYFVFPCNGYEIYYNPNFNDFNDITFNWAKILIS